MERLYTDVYGDEHTRSEWNDHHVFARCTAKGKGRFAREFINQRGLVLPILKPIHVELHRELEFPPLPSPSLMHRINDAMDFRHSGHIYDRYLEYVDQFDSIAKHSGNTDHRRQAGRIAENLAQQSVFILAGQVRAIPVENVA